MTRRPISSRMGANGGQVETCGIGEVLPPSGQPRHTVLGDRAEKARATAAVRLETSSLW